MNIGELKAKLAEMEARWTEQDDSVLGTFDSQQVITDYWEAGEYKGLGPAKLTEYWELGLMVVPETFGGRTRA